MMESLIDEIPGKEEGKPFLNKLPCPAGSGLGSGGKIRWVGPAAGVLTGVMLWGALLLVAWQSIRGEYLRTLDKDLAMAAHHLRMRLSDNLTYLSLLMQRGGEGYGNLGKSAENFLGDHPELTALTLVDGQYGVVERFPETENRPADSRSFPAWIMEKLEKTGKSGQPFYTEVYWASRGEGRFAALIPLENGQHHLIAEYSLEGVLRHLQLPFSGGPYRMCFVDGSGRILSDVSRGPVVESRIHGTLHPAPLDDGIRIAMTRRLEGTGTLSHAILLHGLLWLLFALVAGGFAVWLSAENRRLKAAGERYRGEITALSLCRDKLARHLEKVRAVAEIQDRELSAARKRIADDAASMDQARLALTALHNVGNAVNSLGITSSMIRERVLKSRANNIFTVADIIDGHKYRLAEFFAKDSIGSMLPRYFSMLARHLASEKKWLGNSFHDMAKNIDYIAETVAGLRLDGWRNLGREPVRVPDLLKDAITISGIHDALEEPLYHRRAVEGTMAWAVDRAMDRAVEVQEDPGPILLDRPRVLGILVGLMASIGNDALSKEEGVKRITVGMAPSHGNRIRIQVYDHGARISEEELEKIERGTSPGEKPGEVPLRTGSAAANEMGGSLSVAPNRAGKGVTYTLELPYQPAACPFPAASPLAEGGEDK